MRRSSARRLFRTGALFGTSAAFSPDDLSGLTLWLKADAITGLNDGDPVTTWTDSSSAGNDASQSTAAAKPTYKASIINGKAVVRFDGTDDELNLTTAFSGNTHSIFIVAQANDASSALLGNSANSGDYFVVDAGPVAAFRPMAGTTASASTATAAFRLYEVYYDGSNATVLVNGSAGTSQANTNAFQANRIGHYPVASYLLSGDIAEIVAYNTAHSSGDRDKVRNYLNDKYAVY